MRARADGERDACKRDILSDANGEIESNKAEQSTF